MHPDRCDHVGVTLHASDGSFTSGPRHETIVLRRPSRVGHPEDADLALVAEIIRSGELTAEISAANNHDPDLEV